ncbi:MAG: WG repeat-containing protein, partial [Candidatus Methylomirabilota bacterium]
KTSQDWQVLLLCSIVRERIEKAKEIEHLVQWKPPDELSSRSDRARIQKRGNALAEKAQNIPFVALERFWKDNELGTWKEMGGEYRLYLAHALGVLKLRPARLPLEESLRSEDAMLRETAVMALGSIGDPQSVPVLLSHLEGNISDREGMYVAQAIFSCGKAESVPLLEDKLKHTDDKALRRVLKTLIAEIQAGRLLPEDITSNRYGFVDGNGNFVVRPTFLAAQAFSEGLAAVKTSDGWGYINKTGDVVITPRFQEACSFSEGLAIAKSQGKWGCIDKNGTTAIKAQFDWIQDGFSNGLARVRNNGKWGCIDKKGKTVIELKYDEIGRFSQGLAPVKVGEKWGYIDRSGKTVVEPQFDRAVEFPGKGPAVVMTED